MVNICSHNLKESLDFYTHLFDFKVQYESDWFIHLLSRHNDLELGIIDTNNELVPSEYEGTPKGVYFTFVVKNADEIYKEAVKADVEIVSEPTDTFYGQRRLLIKDPNGALIDVSSPIPNFVFKE